MRATAIIALLLSLSTATAAPAQVDSFAGPLSPGNFWSTMQMDPISQAARQAQEQQAARARGQGATPAVPNPATLGFTPSPERRKANFAAFVEKTRAVNPAGASALQSMFASTDIIAKIGEELKPVGLRTDNLADAYTVWWVNCWSAVHGDFSSPDRATADAVKAQASRALLSTNQLGQASDAQKQEFAEALLIQALLVDASLQQAKGKPDQMKAVASAANQGAKGMGLDMTTMRLTPKGFVPAG